ncbi:hypothetical protein B0H94_102212 [Salsuginibacillus halophilus]|uniref:Uncharacterized protein n=1 Tax=Salsuginibacillus halophilus TaxID=517424 RepID=A0A2P8HXR2_9BACI|nr:hypothetical protein [Salsuginibacillus halophilus]PSL50935.1 hypothetical protein B0H94_102212 [Salsuginibacillus halophilus]
MNPIVLGALIFCAVLVLSFSASFYVFQLPEAAAVIIALVLAFAAEFSFRRTLSS